MADEKKETAPAEPKKEKAPAKKAVKSDPQPLIYVGPTIKGTVLRTFGIFADGIPAEYKENTVVRALFVSPEKLNEARAEVGSTGSKLNVFYKRAAESVKGGK